MYYNLRAHILGLGQLMDGKQSFNYFLCYFFIKLVFLAASHQKIVASPCYTSVTKQNVMDGQPDKQTNKQLPNLYNET